MKKLILIIAVLLFYSLLYSQNETAEPPVDEDLFELDLEDLMNMEVTVASGNALSQRESPGIISVVTADDIRMSGARDLIDVLRMVPGFEFGIDVENATGLGTRGIWAHEGKIVLLIDGQEMNELLYGTMNLGNHYPVDIIKRIEIIRGPGSAMYGGNAELAVINVITYHGEDINGIGVSATHGQLSDAPGRTNFTLNAGKKFENGFEFKLNSFYGQGIRSNKQADDYYGASYNMKNGSDVNPLLINFGAKFKGLSITMLGDIFTTTQKDIFGWYMADEQQAVPTQYNAMLGEIKYDYKLNDKITITPKYNYRQTSSYNVLQSEIDEYGFLDTNSINYHPDVEFLYDRIITRQTMGVHSNMNFTDNINVIAGAEYYMDKAVAQNDRSYFLDDTSYVNEVNYSNIAFYAQSVIKGKYLNYTLGARVVSHSQAGEAFVPRVGITKAWEKFHAKLLYTQAFRSPNIANLDLNKNVVPEKTNVIELEAGYKLTSNLFFTTNIFDITLKDPIIYFVDENGESYENFEQTGTNGCEIELKFLQDKLFANLGYSFYNAKGKNKVDLYATPDCESHLLGFATSKFSLNTGVKLNKLTINPTFTYLSERYYAKYDADYNLSYEKTDPVFFANIFVNYQAIEGLYIGAGVYDILDSKYNFIQPYDGGHAPLPGRGREITMKISYKFNCKK